MTIPASSIHFNGDGTAWLLLYDDAKIGGWAWWKALDTCDGKGRHTFTVEVDLNDYSAVPQGSSVVWGPPLALRVSIREGMVLPITTGYEGVECVVWDGDCFTHCVPCANSRGAADGYSIIRVTLPPDAARLLAEGKKPWAVLLDIHEPIDSKENP